MTAATSMIDNASRQHARTAAPGAVFAALVRAQGPAAASTALYRNQFEATAQASAGRAGTGHDGAGPDGAGPDGAGDFDFLFGRWRVHNDRLAERLVGSTRWEQFDAIAECRPILAGSANIDEFVTDEFGPTLFVGMALRLYDSRTRQWSIHWASNRKAGLEPPVVGAFVAGVGRFEGDDTHDGVPVRVRFTWSDVASEHPLWEQAFSTDGGRTWETNWRMRLTRLPAETASGDQSNPMMVITP